MVLIGGGRTFVVGADIREFGKMASGKPRGAGLLPLLLKIEDSSKPVIVAIHGTTFGGGLELAMAGHYRVAAPRAQLGQPEVKLGLIPGRGRDAALTAARWRGKSRGDVCQWESG
jgi:3-hydroxyacyl-CoA dehydrogenase